MAPKPERQWWKFDTATKPPPEFEKPDCFSEAEWASYYSAEEQAVWSKKNLLKSIRKDMCEDCTLPYQLAQVKLGRCNPYYGAITPAHRAALLMAGEEVNTERKSRATPWEDADEES